MVIHTEKRAKATNHFGKDLYMLRQTKNKTKRLNTRNKQKCFQHKTENILN